MRKPLGFLLLLALGTILVGLGASCSIKTPTASDNFQNPIQTIAGINPPFTATPTYTYTPTNTATPTPSNTPTNTPYVVSTWTGFSGPHDVAVDSNNNFYVADTGNNRVRRYTSSGNLDLTWGYGSKGKGSIAYPTPEGLAVDSSSNLYVVGGASSVGKFDKNGNFLGQLTGATLSNPQGVAVDGSGNIYVTDTGNNRVVKLNSNGSLVSNFGNGGALTLTASTIISSVISSVTIVAPVTLSGIAVNGGDVYVATQGVSVNSSTYSSVLVFDAASGGATVSFAITGFVNPTGLAFDNPGNLYVADTGNEQVEEFSTSSFNQVPLPFNGGVSLLSKPVGVAVDSNGNIYVADSGNNTVFKFAP